MKVNLLAFFLFFPTLLFSQDFSNGFYFLDNGEFDSAKVYFEEKLEEFPDNLTAKICYGRALGLSGEPSEAEKYFDSLWVQNPSNEEVKLNYAESLLWIKDYQKADSVYSSMLDSGITLPVVYLNYANCLSELGDYPKATAYIDTAYKMDSLNLSVLNSRKYIYLAYSYNLALNRKYKESLKVLDQLDKWYPKDEKVYYTRANTLLMAGRDKDALYLYRRAVRKDYDDNEAYAGMSRSFASLGRSNLAIKTAKINLYNDSTQADSIQLANAYLANLQPYKALKYMDTTSSAFDLTKALFFSQIAQHDRALKIIQNSSLSEQEKAKLYINFLNKDIRDFAMKSQLLKYKEKYPEDPYFDKMAFFYANRAKTQLLTDASTTFDSDSNQNYFAKVKFHFPLGTSAYMQFLYNYQRAIAHKDESLINYTQVHQFGGNLIFNPKEEHLFTLQAMANHPRPDSFKLLYMIDYKARLNPKQYLNLGIQKEYQNFNRDLIAEDIYTTHYYINHNIMSRRRVGLFTQFYYSNYSDKNIRQIFYNSLYILLNRTPSWKLGLNAQYMGFEQSPTTYFSPNNFILYEVFTELYRDLNDYHRSFYKLLLALGRQSINHGDYQLTYRIEAELGAKGKRGGYTSIYFNRSNTANNNIAGFTFSQLGLRFRLFPSPKIKKRNY